MLDGKYKGLVKVSQPFCLIIISPHSSTDTIRTIIFILSDSNIILYIVLHK